MTTTTTPPEAARPALSSHHPMRNPVHTPAQSIEDRFPQLASRRAPPGPHRRVNHRHHNNSSSTSNTQVAAQQQATRPHNHNHGAHANEFKTAHCSVFHTSMPGICGYCGKLNAKSFCSACRLAVYCNKECQRTHWKHHKPVCKRLSDVRAVAIAPLLQAAPPSNISVQDQKNHADPITLVALQIFKHFDKRANDYMVYEHVVKQLLDEPIELYGWSNYHIRRIFLTAKGIQSMLSDSIGVRVTPQDCRFRAYVSMTSLKEFRQRGPIVDLGAYDTETSRDATAHDHRHRHSDVDLSVIGQGTDEFTFRHPGTRPQDDEQVSHMGIATPNKYAPVVTKASHHLKAIHFVHADAFGRLVAAYPNQFSIRLDAARNFFIYDCYEYKPPPGAGRLRSDRMQQLPDVALLHQYNTTITCNPPAGIQSIGSDVRSQQTVRKICHVKAMSGEFFRSKCFRFCFPIAHICGIRLLQQSSSSSSEDPWEIPGMLILEFDMPPDDLIHPFCSRTVATKDSRFEPIPDWTPGQHASKATRHYICGAFLELQELVAHLCKLDAHVASMVQGTGGTLSDANLDFSKAPAATVSTMVEVIAEDQRPKPDAFDGSMECLLDCVKDRLRAMSEAGNPLGAIYIANQLGLGDGGK